MYQPNFASVIVEVNGETYVTVFAPGHDPLPAASSHPNFESIVKACRAEQAHPGTVNAEDVVDLFDVGAAVSKRFEKLSDRVSVKDGRIYLDGDAMESGLTKQVLRFMDEGEDFRPLVNFMEKIETNPNVHSRTQAWDWLNNHDFTLLPNGDVVGYKGVRSDGKGGFVSGFQGHAIVDGEDVNGYIPTNVGSVIEMPRSEVQWDPSSACASGLHFGTFEYAKGYASGAMLKVAVNPRDIVSVPTDAGGEKMRCCRYEILEVIDAPVNTALDRAYADGYGEDDGLDLGLDMDEDDEETCECGLPVDECDSLDLCPEEDEDDRRW